MATKLSPHENHSAYYTVQALRGPAIKKKPTHKPRTNLQTKNITFYSFPDYERYTAYTYI